MKRHQWIPDEDVLEGASIPAWLAAVLNVAGRTAAVSEVNRRLEEGNIGVEGLSIDTKPFIPEGRFTMLPDFTVLISTDENYVTYDYKVAVSANEGMNSRANKILGLGPGFLGLQLHGSAAAKILGREKAVDFRVTGSATIKDESGFDLDRYRPRVLTALGFKGLKLEKGTGVELETGFTNFLRNNARLDAQLRHKVSGAVLMSTEADITERVGKTPILLVMNKALGSYAPKFVVTLFGNIILTSETNWSTERPGTGSVIATKHVKRAHVLGGDESIVARADNQKPGIANKFDLGFNLGASLTVSGGGLYATGTLELRGEERRFPDVPDGRKLSVA
ncbi:MAG: hypothetical protein MI923_25745, partial [Phycisphaerales bacterium]|nr:hypothetical protein [Phycisphaerales bacterium]